MRTQAEADEAERQFLSAVHALADAVQERYPAWAAALRARPSVFVPHKHHRGCCEFPAEHPIHGMPEWGAAHVLGEDSNTISRNAL